MQHPDFGELWFSEQFSFSVFADLGIPVNEDMSKDIACFEALAQGALIFSASALLPACRVRVILKSLSDNTAAEAGLNSLFTAAFPLALFLERIAVLAAQVGAYPEVSHIPGELNDRADALSRYPKRDIPSDCLPCNRVRFSLAQLWHPQPRVRVFPPYTQLRWFADPSADTPH